MDSEARVYSVYKHTVNENGKVYIGITSKKPERRWGNGHGYTKSQYFAKAIAKYGWENISHEVLFTELTRDEANAKEIELIALYDSTNHAKGYNIAKGGKGTFGVKASAETKRRLSESHKNGKQPKAIPVICVETGEVYRSMKIAAEATGANYRGIQACLSGKNHKTGGLHFEYAGDGIHEKKYKSMTRAEAALIGSKVAKEKNCKPVRQLDLDGNELAVFASTRDAARSVTAGDSSHISCCCLGHRKTAYGYKWEFIECA